jgi:hypothetical protein
VVLKTQIAGNTLAAFPQCKYALGHD